MPFITLLAQLRIQKPNDLSAGLEFNRETSAVIYLSPFGSGADGVLKIQASEACGLFFLDWGLGEEHI